MKHRTVTDVIKLQSGCVACGYSKHPSALTFDHVIPENKYKTKNGKVVHISDMVKGNRYSLKTILDEIRKCRVICFNCHMEHTYTVQRPLLED